MHNKTNDFFNHPLEDCFSPPSCLFFNAQVLRSSVLNRLQLPFPNDFHCAEVLLQLYKFFCDCTFFVELHVKRVLLAGCPSWHQPNNITVNTQWFKKSKLNYFLFNSFSINCILEVRRVVLASALILSLFKLSKSLNIWFFNLNSYSVVGIVGILDIVLLA